MPNSILNEMMAAAQYNSTLKATLVLVIHPQTGRILGATRRGTSDQWGLIGGKQDEGETLDACAIREFFEETSVMPTHEFERIFNRICDESVDGKTFDVHVYQMVSAADIAAVTKAFQEPREVEPDILVGFVDYTEMLKGPFGKFNADLLNAVLFHYNQKSMKL